MKKKKKSQKNKTKNSLYDKYVWKIKNNQLLVIIIIVTVGIISAGDAIKKLNYLFSDDIEEHSIPARNVITANQDATINISNSFNTAKPEYSENVEKYKEELFEAHRIIIRKLDRIEKLKTENSNIKIIEQDLRAQLNLVNEKLSNVSQAYDEKVMIINRQLQDIDSFKELVPDEQIKKAKSYILNGDIRNANLKLEEIGNNSLSIAAKTFYMRGELSEIDYNFKKATEFYVKASDLDEENAIYKQNAGYWLGVSGQTDKSIEYLEKALDFYKNTPKINSLDAASIYMALAEAFGDKNDFKKSAVYHDKVLRIYKNHYGEDNSEYGYIYNNIGKRLLFSGKSSESISYFERAIEIFDLLYGENHPNSWAFKANLGSAYLAENEDDLALEHYYKSLDTLENHVYTFAAASVRVSIGNILSSKGKHSEAIELYELAIPILEASYGSSHSAVIAAKKNLSVIKNKLPLRIQN